MSRLRRRDRGASAVETALVLPLLLLLVFGVIDFGRMLNTQITLTEAAREGARAVALGSPPAPRIDTALGNLGEPDAVVVEECGPTPGPEDDAQVEIKYTFRFVTPVGALASVFTGDGFGGDVSMSAVGVMPCRA